MSDDELMKKTNEMMSTWGLTADDLKALAPVPDENDPGSFDDKTPHADDEAWCDVQVPFAGGWSQCLLSGYLK